MKSGTDLINEAKSRIREVSPAEARKLHERGGVTFLDVRDQQEVNLGRIPGALHISRGTMETKIEAAVPRETEVVIYCASGNRSALAADTHDFEARYLDGAWHDILIFGRLDTHERGDE